MSLFLFDEQFRQNGATVICGVDEAGRGPLAGPVFAAAVILKPNTDLAGLNDSKKLTEKRREALYTQIIDQAACYGIASADEMEIDELNILQASLLAMRRAVEKLVPKPDCILVDGNQNPGIPDAYTETVIKGDGKSASIAAASILAKVARDHFLIELDQEYPQYQFAKHKGYPTKLHYQLLDTYGPCPVHRRSFLKKWMKKALG